MAPAGAKRQRLNPRKGQKAVHKPTGSTSSEPRKPVVRESEDLPSQGDASDEEISSRAAGVSYGVLLSSLQQRNGQTPKKSSISSGTKPANDARLQTSPSPVSVQDDPSNEEDGIQESEVKELDGEEGEHAIGSRPDTSVDQEDEDASDPFESHFANSDDNELSRRLEAVKGGHWNLEQKNTVLGKQTIMKPTVESKTYTAQSIFTSLHDMQLKSRLIEPATKLMLKFDTIQKVLAPDLLNYHDALYCGRSPQNAESLRNIACLHALNHIFKTRDRVIKNSTRLARDKGESDLELRDQGFSRPKVLILLETRNACSQYMETITKICAPDQQENKKRFEDGFVQAAEKFSDDKPMDFRELFEGNDDNEFRLGVKFTRKTIKYYSQFYSSDIILASPLGLRRAINADDPKKSDFDFLSSIEIVVVDQADAMLMQNWEHVEFVFDHLNLQPKEAHDCDFSRVRPWYLDQSAKYLRQTIVFSAYLTPELNRLFSSQMQNVAGKMKLVPEYDGVIQNTGLQIRQIFSRFRCGSPASDPDDRFKYFITSIIPQLIRQISLSSEGLGALIFIPSYLDFVRVRNYFSTSQDTRNLTFGSLSEYTELRASRRGRSHFFTGKQSVMLYTGRAHHFRRYHLQGVKRVFFYGLPDNPAFFNEIASAYMGSTIAAGKLNAGEASAKIMFSQWDSLALERIVGSKRAARMLKDSSGDTFEFR